MAKIQKTLDLKRFRTDKNLTQVEIASLLDVKQNFISDCEKGKKPFPEYHITTLEKRYGDISDYVSESVALTGISSEDARVLVSSVADVFTKQLLQLYSEKIIVPYSLMEEKDREISKLNQTIGALQKEIYELKKK